MVERGLVRLEDLRVEGAATVSHNRLQGSLYFPLKSNVNS